MIGTGQFLAAGGVFWLLGSHAWDQVTIGTARQQAAEHYQQAAAFFRARQAEKAIAELRRSLQLDPQQARAEKLLGLSCQLINRNYDAESAFLRACSLAPRDPEAWFFLGRLYYLQNFFDKARQALETALSYDSRDFRIHETLALALEAEGNLEGALEEYRQAVRWNTGTQASSASPHLNFGILLYKLDQLRESEEQLRRARELGPKDWQACFELGKLYLRQEKLEAAARELEAALKLGTADAGRVYYLLAQVYARMGREDDARSAFAMSKKNQK